MCSFKPNIFLLSILFVLHSFCLIAQEEVYKKNPTFFEKAIKNMSFEIMGMRSIVFQKEPYPLVPWTTYSSNLSGYIPIPSYSFQVGVLKEIKLSQRIYVKSGIQYKLLNKKFERVASWTPIIPGINSSLYRYQKTYFFTVSNYLAYKIRNIDFCLGANFLALYTNDSDFPPDIEKYYALLLRIERNMKILKSFQNEIALFIESEGRGNKWNYYQIKLGIKYKIK